MISDTAVLWLVVSVAVFAVIMFVIGMIKTIKDRNPLGLLVIVLIIVALIVFI